MDNILRIRIPFLTQDVRIDTNFKVIAQQINALPRDNTISDEKIKDGTISQKKLSFTLTEMGTLDDLNDGAYGKILSTEISAGHINLMAVSVVDPSFTTDKIGEGDSHKWDTGIPPTILDQLADGTYKKVLAADFTAEHIKLAAITQDTTHRVVTDTEKGTWNGKPDDMDAIGQGSTYWKLAQTEIEAGHIRLSTAYGTLDNIANGADYGKVALTSIGAGKIIVAGLDNDVIARMFADGDAKTNIEAWRHASDVTLIDGGDIYTKSITVEKLDIATITDNLILNPSFEQEGGWALIEGAGAATYNAAQKTEGSYSLLLPAPNVAWGCRAIPLVPGDKYTVRVKVASAAGATAAGLYIGMFEKDSYPAGDYVTTALNDSVTYFVGNGAIPVSWTTYEYTYTVPAGVYWGTLGVWNWAGGQVAGVCVDEAEVRKQLGAVHIEDGVITAVKINVAGLDGATGRIRVADETDANVLTGGINTHATTLITAGKIVISGAVNLSDWRMADHETTIDGGKIYTGTIVADSIAADAIETDKIKAGAVTAVKIDVATLSAIKADMGTLTAGKIAVGSIEINADMERILMGAASAPMTGIGVFIGKDGAAYEFRCGNPAGHAIHWDGATLKIWKGGSDIDAQELQEGATRARMYISNEGSYAGRLRVDYTQVYHNDADYNLKYYDQGGGVYLLGFSTGSGGSSGTGESCFPAKTKILMADNSIKNIGDIRVGDYVLTKESETSSKTVEAKVLKVYKHPKTGDFFMINDALKVTPNHRMLINEIWQRVENLKIGDMLLGYDNNKIIVESIKRQNWKAEKVYNLEIEKYRTYFADGFYVHNSKDPG